MSFSIFSIATMFIATFMTPLLFAILGMAFFANNTDELYKKDKINPEHIRVDVAKQSAVAYDY